MGDSRVSAPAISILQQKSVYKMASLIYNYSPVTKECRPFDSKSLKRPLMRAIRVKCLIVMWNKELKEKKDWEWTELTGRETATDTTWYVCDEIISLAGENKQFLVIFPENTSSVKRECYIKYKE